MARGAGQHGIAHGLHAMLTQAGNRALVFTHQQLAEQVAHLLHPKLPDIGRHSRIAHHLLQGTDIAFGAQRIALWLHTAQALRCTDQRVQLCQHRIGGMQRRLLSLGQLHLRLHFVVVQQRELAEVHSGVFGGQTLGTRWPLGKDFQQRHGVPLYKGCLVLIEQTQAVADQIALLNVAVDRLVTRQGALRYLDKLPHQGLAPAHGIDDAGTKNRS